jgi:drug/metabolite transporter (DMT)-like permease
MAGLRGKALIAYLLVCTVWGSTYLAIRVGVMHLPPMLFAGIRFVVAGLLLAGIVLATRDRLPRRARDWGVNAVTGVFLLLGGNAVVVWAEQHVESGAASVFVAAVPLWAAFFDALWPGGTTVFTWRVAAGLALGFLGSALLAGVTPGEVMQADLAGPVALTLASASWALGTVYSKRNPTDTSPFAASAVQMLAGGAVITLLGLALGETSEWRWSAEGLGALAYLVVFGSIVGFTAYAYALRHASATVVGTYAYVNPVVAVLLGGLILGEAITGRTLGAMVLILGAVLMIQLSPGVHGKSGPSPGRAATAPRRHDLADKPAGKTSGNAAGKPADNAAA